MSLLTWMDFSEQERRQAMELIDMLNEPEARDELGIGTVRDALSDILFPGTSTIQTRAKYFLFIPWMYLELEKRRTPSKQIAKEARRYETEILLQSLLASDDTDGVIGREAGKTLKRLPSSVYWQGLSRWGIRMFQGSQDAYHRSLDAHYLTRSRKITRTDEGEATDEIWHNWHPGIPNKPEGFPNSASYRLEVHEAAYLRDRILHHAQRSMLAQLVRLEAPFEPAAFPWELEAVQEMPKHVRASLQHAKRFSYAIHGASLLYNLMLAKKVPADDLIHRYENMLAEWWQKTGSLQEEFLTWDQGAFWELVKQENARIPERTQAFIQTWIQIVLSALDQNHSLEHLVNHPRHQLLIKERELQLKRGKARLSHPKALQGWLGESGAAQLNYRWRVSQTIVLDILNGLKGNEPHA